MASSDDKNKGNILSLLNHIKDEEIEHIEELRSISECEICGTRLNDSGTCPSCDHGEEDLGEKFDYTRLYQKVENQETSVDEGIIGDLLFDSTLANDIYDEFYHQ